MLWLSTADALAKLIRYDEIKQCRNHVTSALAIDIKSALLKTMSNMDLSEAPRC